MLSSLLALENATVVINASQAYMSTTISTLVSTFDIYDAAATPVITDFYAAMNADMGEIQAKLNIVGNLTQQTLGFQQTLNTSAAASAVLSLFTSGVSALQSSVAYFNISLANVLKGIEQKYNFTSNPSLLAVFEPYLTCMTAHSKNLQLYFPIFKYNTSVMSTSRQRSLLGPVAGPTNTTANVYHSLFNGYAFAPDGSSTVQYNLYDTQNYDPARCVGNGCNNRIMGGLFLHATWKTAEDDPLVYSIIDGPPQLCHFTSFPQLIPACNANNKTAGDIFAISTNIGGVGTDAAFNPLSSLYNQNLSISDYYNTSAGSRDLNNLTGSPYGFFHYPLTGYPNGYPVVFTPHLPAAQSRNILTYLYDGGLLNPVLCKSMTMQIGTYNPEGVSFGYYTATFVWEDSGSIAMTTDVIALPAVSYGTNLNQWHARQMVPDFLLLGLILLYIVASVVDIVNDLKVERRRSQMRRQVQKEKKEADPVALSQNEEATLALGGVPISTPVSHALSMKPLASVVIPEEMEEDVIPATSCSLALSPVSNTSKSPRKLLQLFTRTKQELNCSPLKNNTVTSPSSIGHSALTSNRSNSRTGPLSAGFFHSPKKGMSGMSRFGSPRPIAESRESSTGAADSVAKNDVELGDVYAPQLSGPSLLLRAPKLKFERSATRRRVVEQEQEEEAKKLDVRKKRGVLVRPDFKYEARSHTFFWTAWEVILSGLMVSCIAVWFVYAMQLVNSNIFATSFNIYDADAFAQARYLLPTRFGNSSDLHGTPGRWKLPDNLSGMDGIANMMYQMTLMNKTYVIYYFLQGMVLIGLILRLVMYLTFQKRFSVIGATLVLAIPDLFNLLIVIMIVLVMLTEMVYITFGNRVEEVSTFSRAIYTMVLFFFSGDDSHFFADATVESHNIGDQIITVMFRALATPLVHYVLFVFFFVTILFTFHSVFENVRHAPTVGEDLGMIIKQWKQKVVGNAPSNGRVQKILVKLLEVSGQRRPVLTLMKMMSKRAVSAASTAVSSTSKLMKSGTFSRNQGLSKSNSMRFSINDETNNPRGGVIGQDGDSLDLMLKSLGSRMAMDVPHKRKEVDAADLDEFFGKSKAASLLRSSRSFRVQQVLNLEGSISRSPKIYTDGLSPLPKIQSAYSHTPIPASSKMALMRSVASQRFHSPLKLPSVAYLKRRTASSSGLQVAACGSPPQSPRAQPQIPSEEGAECTPLGIPLSVGTNVPLQQDDHKFTASPRISPRDPVRMPITLSETEESDSKLSPDHPVFFNPMFSEGTRLSGGHKVVEQPHQEQPDRSLDTSPILTVGSVEGYATSLPKEAMSIQQANRTASLPSVLQPELVHTSPRMQASMEIEPFQSLASSVRSGSKLAEASLGKLNATEAAAAEALASAALLGAVLGMTEDLAHMAREVKAQQMAVADMSALVAKLVRVKESKGLIPTSVHVAEELSSSGHGDPLSSSDHDQETLTASDGVVKLSPNRESVSNDQGTPPSWGDAKAGNHGENEHNDKGTVTHADEAAEITPEEFDSNDSETLKTSDMVFEQGPKDSDGNDTEMLSLPGDAAEQSLLEGSADVVQPAILAEVNTENNHEDSSIHAQVTLGGPDCRETSSERHGVGRMSLQLNSDKSSSQGGSAPSLHDLPGISQLMLYDGLDDLESEE
ncbi:hypothetical protein CEUSTIGMA_g5147.t1 [Chlamydomonas eustigma]|uniref:Polycystin cation channel PKD1/PKD2 domain-containing protein n=1 Tax=Chlamydomonas eustigma TaxID=1157962 RepID=A0A250X3P7_9CHLO|nr:hypothetical protein CEUSTIGMA_g5147.t1 [Chlamydomonas eustigma]|eukprot:GAX77704.1 hypothetical protein CEUSTIGMA_g5147.t1 [Chlamydomonas eustigma]